METSLDRMEPDKWATVTDMAIDRALKRRLADFGLIPGTRVCCRFCSPWADVTALELRGTVIAMRTRDLRQIRVRC